MKKFFAYALSLTMIASLCGLASCDKEKVEEEQPVEQIIIKAIPDGNYTATGSFNGKYPITMEFTVKDHKLAGRYYYNRMGPGNALDIVGRVDSTFVEIQEFDPYGTNSGDFKGDVTDGVIRGVFTAHSNYNTLPFEITFQEENSGINYLNTVSYVQTFDFGPELQPVEVAAEVEDEPVVEKSWWEKILDWFN